MALDHVMLKVKDWQRAKQYYKVALKPLGYEPVSDWGTGGGFGVPGEKRGNIFVSQGLSPCSACASAFAAFAENCKALRAEAEPTRLHLSFAAPTEQALRDYHAAAVSNGGKDNGAPGPRAHVPGGLACFVVDLDNNNLECDYRP